MSVNTPMLNLSKCAQVTSRVEDAQKRSVISHVNTGFAKMPMLKSGDRSITIVHGTTTKAAKSFSGFVKLDDLSNRDPTYRTQSRLRNYSLAAGLAHCNMPTWHTDHILHMRPANHTVIALLYYCWLCSNSMAGWRLRSIVDYRTLVVGSSCSSCRSSLITGAMAFAGRVCRIGMTSLWVLVVGCFSMLWCHLTAVMGLCHGTMAALLIRLRLLGYIALLWCLCTWPSISTCPVVCTLASGISLSPDVRVTPCLRLPPHVRGTPIVRVTLGVKVTPGVWVTSGVRVSPVVEAAPACFWVAPGIRTRGSGVWANSPGLCMPPGLKRGPLASLHGPVKVPESCLCLVHDVLAQQFAASACMDGTLQEGTVHGRDEGPFQLMPGLLHTQMEKAQYTDRCAMC